MFQRRQRLLNVFMIKLRLPHLGIQSLHSLVSDCISFSSSTSIPHIQRYRHIKELSAYSVFWAFRLSSIPVLANPVATRHMWLIST